MADGHSSATKLPGHSLVRKGWPHDANGEPTALGIGGHAKCSCGWLSEWIPTQRGRQRAHAKHKQRLREVRR